MQTIRRIDPAPGQESVWDYPRPPRVEASSKTIRVIANGRVIAETTRSKRILETSHPPVYYVPPEDVRLELLKPAQGASMCEWKGVAGYFDVVIGDSRIRGAAWSYPNPTKPYRCIKDHIAFYPSKMDLCTVDDEIVAAQEGDFYGGWITGDIVGPFKGAAGTRGW